MVFLKVFCIYWVLSGIGSLIWGLFNLSKVSSLESSIDIAKELDMPKEKAIIFLFIGALVFGFIALPVALFRRFLK
jgi:phosphotransferase system  glucose/maltose/N-acetylglucosamine-specific IIC component